jgi:hypothetical protein
LPEWPAHEAGANDRAIILDAEPSSERLPGAARLALYDRLFAELRRGSRAQ